MSLKQDQWFTEAFEDRTAFSFRHTGIVYDKTSDFQRVQIFDSEVLGRVLVLDGCFMVTEKDSFIYHEMLVHPAMAVAREPRKALVIGGGDGGAVTELVKYPELQSVTLCEIDPMVVSACREYFPEISAGLTDPRVNVAHEDGSAFIRSFEAEFDVILVDSTDPVGPGKALFEVSFFEDIKRGLKPGGVAVFQTESPLFMEKVFSAAVRDLQKVFGTNEGRPYLAPIPTYPGALWSFTFCSLNRDPLGNAPNALRPELTKRLRYWTPEVHRASFALPVFVEDLITEG